MSEEKKRLWDEFKAYCWAHKCASCKYGKCIPERCFQEYMKEQEARSE